MDRVRGTILKVCLRTSHKSVAPRNGCPLIRPIGHLLPRGGEGPEVRQRAKRRLMATPSGAAAPPRRTASVSWLVETCHARTTRECDRAPRGSTRLVQTPTPASCRAGARALRSTPATGRMGKRRTAPYSRWGPTSPPTPPKNSLLHFLLSPFSAAGRCPWGRTSRFVRPLRVHHQPRVAAPAATRGSCPPKLRKPGDPACPTRPVRPTSRPSAALSRTPLGVQVNPGARQPGVFASLDPRLMSVTPTGVCVLQPPRRHQTTSRQPRPTCPTAGAPSTTNRSPVPRTTSTHDPPRRGQRNEPGVSEATPQELPLNSQGPREGCVKA
jgi:hypothetical protein